MPQLLARHGFQYGFDAREEAETQGAHLRARGHEVEVVLVYYYEGPVWQVIDHTVRRAKQGEIAIPESKAV